MGAWGINLVKDSDRIETSIHQPTSLGIKPKDIRNTEELNMGALVGTWYYLYTTLTHLVNKLVGTWQGFIIK